MTTHGRLANGRVVVEVELRMAERNDVVHDPDHGQAGISDDAGIGSKAIGARNIPVATYASGASRTTSGCRVDTT